MGSVVMILAALTSAYSVKKNWGNWREFDLPRVFWYSTLTIILISIAIHLATKAFKAREMSRYRMLITITARLGILFIVLQYTRFRDLENSHIALTGPKTKSAASCRLMTTGLHMVHVLGGWCDVLVVFIRA